MNVLVSLALEAGEGGSHERGPFSKDRAGRKEREGEHECGVRKPESRERGGEDEERKEDETDMCNQIQEKQRMDTHPRSFMVHLLG